MASYQSRNRQAAVRDITCPQQAFDDCIIVSSNRYLDIAPYAGSVYSAEPQKWGHIMPWQFPQNASKRKEESFLQTYFDDREIYMQGGAHGAGNGYRFLKQVWYTIAIWNHEQRVPAIAQWWINKDASQELLSDSLMLEHMLKPDAKPSTFFTAREVELYGDELLTYVVAHIQHYVSQQQEKLLNKTSPTLVKDEAAQPIQSPEAVDDVNEQKLSPASQIEQDRIQDNAAADNVSWLLGTSDEAANIKKPAANSQQDHAKKSNETEKGTPSRPIPGESTSKSSQALDSQPQPSAHVHTPPSLESGAQNGQMSKQSRKTDLEATSTIFVPHNAPPPAHYSRQRCTTQPYSTGAMSNNFYNHNHNQNYRGRAQSFNHDQRYQGRNKQSYEKKYRYDGYGAKDGLYDNENGPYPFQQGPTRTVNHRPNRPPQLTIVTNTADMARSRSNTHADSAVCVPFQHQIQSHDQSQIMPQMEINSQSLHNAPEKVVPLSDLASINTHQSVHDEIAQLPGRPVAPLPMMTPYPPMQGKVPYTEMVGPMFIGDNRVDVKTLICFGPSRESYRHIRHFFLDIGATSMKDHNQSYDGARQTWVVTFNNHRQAQKALAYQNLVFGDSPLHIVVPREFWDQNDQQYHRRFFPAPEYAHQHPAMSGTQTPLSSDQHRNDGSWTPQTNPWEGQTPKKDQFLMRQPMQHASDRNSKPYFAHHNETGRKQHNEQSNLNDNFDNRATFHPKKRKSKNKNWKQPPSSSQNDSLGNVKGSERDSRNSPAVSGAAASDDKKTSIAVVHRKDDARVAVPVNEDKSEGKVKKMKQESHASSDVAVQVVGEQSKKTKSKKASDKLAKSNASSDAKSPSAQVAAQKPTGAKSFEESTGEASLSATQIALNIESSLDDQKAEASLSIDRLETVDTQSTSDQQTAKAIEHDDKHNSLGNEHNDKQESLGNEVKDINQDDRGKLDITRKDAVAVEEKREHSESPPYEDMEIKTSDEKQQIKPSAVETVLSTPEGRKDTKAPQQTSPALPTPTSVYATAPPTPMDVKHVSVEQAAIVAPTSDKKLKAKGPSLTESFSTFGKAKTKDKKKKKGKSNEKSEQSIPTKAEGSTKNGQQNSQSKKAAGTNAEDMNQQKVVKDVALVERQISSKKAGKKVASGATSKETNDLGSINESAASNPEHGKGASNDTSGSPTKHKGTSLFDRTIGIFVRATSSHNTTQETSVTHPTEEIPDFVTDEEPVQAEGSDKAKDIGVGEEDSQPRETPSAPAEPGDSDVNEPALTEALVASTGAHGSECQDVNAQHSQDDATNATLTDAAPVSANTKRKKKNKKSGTKSTLFSFTDIEQIAHSINTQTQSNTEEHNLQALIVAAPESDSKSGSESSRTLSRNSSSTASDSPRKHSMPPPEDNHLVKAKPKRNKRKRKVVGKTATEADSEPRQLIFSGRDADGNITTSHITGPIAYVIEPDWGTNIAGIDPNSKILYIPPRSHSDQDGSSSGTVQPDISISQDASEQSVPIMYDFFNSDKEDANHSKPVFKFELFTDLTAQASQTQNSAQGEVQEDRIIEIMDDDVDGKHEVVEVAEYEIDGDEHIKSVLKHD